MSDFHSELDRVLRYSMDSADNLLAQLQSPEHNPTRWGLPSGDHTFRLVLADALQERGREEEAHLLRDPNQHLVVHQGQVKKGRFTTGHINRAVRELVNHTTHWSGGQWEAPGCDWADVSGRRHGDLRLEADTPHPEQDDLPDPDHIHPNGTVHVSHFDNDGHGEVYHHFIHHSELGPHLADLIGDEVNLGDYGWNTDGFITTHLDNTNIDSHRLGQLHLPHASRLERLYNNHDLEPWQLPDAIREAELLRDRYQKEIDRSEKYEQENPEAEENLSHALHVLDALNGRQQELGDVQHAQGQEFDRLSHQLRTAPFEEPVPE